MQSGIFLAHDLGDAALVRRIGVGVQEDKCRPRVMPACAEELRGGAHAFLVERPQLLAEKIQPAADLADIAQRHDALRLHPEIGIAVALRHRLPGDLENVAEAVGDDQAEAGDLALQQRVGRDRRAVREHGKIVDAGAPFAENGMDAAHQRNGRICRRRRHLGHPHRAGSIIDTDDVGKGAAGIDADPQLGAAAHIVQAPSSSAGPALPEPRLDPIARGWLVRGFEVPTCQPQIA